MKYLIFLDVDGTLIDYHAHLPKSASRALNLALYNGHKVYICTGCSKAEILERPLPDKLTGMIGGNGAYIESDQKVLFHKSLTLEECRHFVDWCRKRDLAHRLECNSGMYISDDYEEKSAVARYRYGHGINADISKMPKTELPPYMHKNENMYRDDCNKTAFVLHNYQDYLDAKEEFKNLTVDTWGGVGEHALYGAVGVKNINKYTAVKTIIQHYEHQDYRSIAFGDAAVDIPMFQAADIGVAMGNGSVEVKEASDYITTNVNQDGIYKAFQHFGII